MGYLKDIGVEGKTAFDIGAYRGDVTYSLLNRGASRVVAVEMQAQLSEKLRQRFAGNDKVIVVNAAISYEKGETMMYGCQFDTLASTNKAWQTGRFSSLDWRSIENVRTITLDSLIEEYGLPHFIKIDTEGSEYNALTGLSFPINHVAFEFVGEFKSLAILCARRLLELGNYRFGISIGDFGFPRLSSIEGDDGLEKGLNDLIKKDKNMWGMIYAELCDE